MSIKRMLFVLGVLGLLALSGGAAAAQENVVVTWWHINTNEPEAAFWQTIADEYMAEHPNVTIEITVLENEAFKSRLVTVMQAGDPPDLFQSWGGGVLWQFAQGGLVRDIAPELEGEWRESFNAQAALELYGRDGAYYGVPWQWGAVGIFYNRVLFEQAGLDPDAPPATWEEFLAAVQVLKDAGITPIALGGRDKWPGHFWWVYLAMRLGGEEAFLNAYNRTGSFADEPFVMAGEYLNQLIALEPFQEDFLALGYSDQAGLMGNAGAAMELMGQWAPGAQAGNSESGEGIGEDLGWFPFPAIEEGAGNATDVLGGGDGFAVGVNAEDEAVDFLRYITSVDVQRRATEIWIVPVVAGTEDLVAEDPILTAIVEARDAAEYFQLYYDQFLPPAVGQTVNDSVEQLFAGVSSPEEVAQAIEESAAFELEP
jgi:raffinose/stachyose/melibiose transport system substrate-binding protein